MGYNNKKKSLCTKWLNNECTVCARPPLPKPHPWLDSPGNTSEINFDAMNDCFWCVTWLISKQTVRTKPRECMLKLISVYFLKTMCESVNCLGSSWIWLSLFYHHILTFHQWINDQHADRLMHKHLLCTRIMMHHYREKKQICVDVACFVINQGQVWRWRERR